MEMEEMTEHAAVPPKSLSVDLNSANALESGFVEIKQEPRSLTFSADLLHMNTGDHAKDSNQATNSYLFSAASDHSSKSEASHLSAAFQPTKLENPLTGSVPSSLVPTRVRARSGLHQRVRPSAIQPRTIRPRILQRASVPTFSVPVRDSEPYDREENKSALRAVPFGFLAGHHADTLQGTSGSNQPVILRLLDPQIGGSPLEDPLGLPSTSAEDFPGVNVVNENRPKIKVRSTEELGGPTQRNGAVNGACFDATPVVCESVLGPQIKTVKTEKKDKVPDDVFQAMVACLKPLGAKKRNSQRKYRAPTVRQIKKAPCPVVKSKPTGKPYPVYLYDEPHPPAGQSANHCSISLDASDGSEISENIFTFTDESATEVGVNADEFLSVEIHDEDRLYDEVTSRKATAKAKPRKKKRKKEPNSQASDIKSRPTRRASQYAEWDSRPKVTNYADFFGSSEEEWEKEPTIPQESSDSDGFKPDEAIVSSSEDEEEELAEETLSQGKRDLRELTKKEKALGPKESSVFSLELISKILEIPVEDLDADNWNKKIEMFPDLTILKLLLDLDRKRRRYKCHKCGIQVHGDASAMEEHMRKVHVTSLSFGCFFCPLARPSEKELLLHEKCHCYPNPKLMCIICDHKCNVQTVEVDARKVHEAVHPPIEEIALLSPKEQVNIWQSCCYPNCRNTSKFSNKFKFVRHVYLRHVPGDSVCHLCGTTMNFFTLTGHLKTCHKPQEPQKCEACGEMCKVYNKHDCSGKFDCDICGAKFTHISASARHKRNVHGTKMHSCHYCARTFPTEKTLQDHINTHTGEKPYQCLACGSWHTSQAGLAMHLRSRHNLTTKQMKDKYKNCEPDPYEDFDPKPELEDSGEPVNQYTGRKKGRPKVKKAKKSEHSEEEV